jgi:hypothetical protein
MSKRSLASCAIRGLLLGVLTFWIAGAAGSMLPYSQLRDTITDAASIPALLITRIFYPEGIHTGGGAATWGIAFFGAGILFYGVIWFCILLLADRWSRKKVG